jgi:hypothetical protein
MNIQAAFSTLFVVLGVGALTGYSDWKRNEGAPLEVQTARAVSSCIAQGKTDLYQAHPTVGGPPVEVTNKQIEADCRALVQGTSGASNLPSYLSDAKTTPKKEPGRPAAPARLTPEQVAASGKSWCLEKIEEARKRSPGGLNPEWEKSERDRCTSQ